ncbi:MAG: tRNA-dihydrouridine synthase family protein, partial [Candidatus Thermoplasmatota archaeon]|nr:tRNA-dihydrouridine synthase family protein [Candidatus Thermoplasmatota archaeon]
GVNCTAFRLLCKENGANLIYTQMIDADIINEKNYDELKDFLNIQPQEHPVTVQIIGSNKKSLGRAVKKVEPFADIIDLNIGCIVEDYLAKKTGAYLLKDIQNTIGLFSSMVNATNKPVSAKIRIGWDAQTINAVKVTQLLEEAGASAVCIHGRTAQQKYAGMVNWTIMKQVKEKTRIPIIANGDIDSIDAGEKLLSKTNCDLVMIGRESMHRPWVFSQKTIDIKEQIFRFIDLYTQYEKRQSIQEVADHVFWMLRDYETLEDTKKIHLLRTIPQIKRFVSRLP